MVFIDWRTDEEGVRARRARGSTAVGTAALGFPPSFNDQHLHPEKYPFQHANFYS
jgi:hypothetical protein